MSAVVIAPEDEVICVIETASQAVFVEVSVVVLEVGVVSAAFVALVSGIIIYNRLYYSSEKSSE